MSHAAAERSWLQSSRAGLWAQRRFSVWSRVRYGSREQTWWSERTGVNGTTRAARLKLADRPGHLTRLRCSLFAEREDEPALCGCEKLKKAEAMGMAKCEWERTPTCSGWRVRYTVVEGRLERELTARTPTEISCLSLAAKRWI